MKSFKKILYIILIAAILLTGSSTAYCEFSDGIIAVVNDDIITMHDFRQFLSLIYINLTSAGKSKEEISEIMTYYQENGLGQLIDDKLIIDEANKRDLIIRPELIDKRMDKIKTKFETEKDFLDDLVSQGLTVSEARNKIIEDLKKEYIVNAEILSKVFVSPQDVTNFYEENLDKFKTSESVELNSIFIENDKDNPKYAAQQARKTLKLLTNRTNQVTFEEVAKDFSNSSSIGKIVKGQTLPEIEKIVFSLKEGEISSAVEVDTGIYIFKVKKKISKHVEPLENVKELINNMLTKEAINKRQKEWIQKLRDNAYIEIKK